MIYKKFLGQHFFVNKSFLERLVNLTGVNKNDIVLEIGTGNGNLTKILTKKAHFVLSVEIDSNLYESVKNTLDFNGGLILANCNILNDNRIEPLIEDLILNHIQQISLTPKVISNPPYNIISPLLEALVSSKICFKDIYLVLQKEIADRIVAKTGNKEYSSLSVFIQSFCKVKILRYISKENFFPIPKVDSAFIHIKPEGSFNKKFEHYSTFLKKAFSLRRKNIKNVYTLIFDEETARAILNEFRLQENYRCENLPPTTFKQIYEHYYLKIKK